jgi:hypothetical protein
MRNTVLFFRYTFVATRFLLAEKPSTRFVEQTTPHTRAHIQRSDSQQHGVSALLAPRDIAARSRQRRRFTRRRDSTKSQRVTKSTQQRAQREHDPVSLQSAPNPVKQQRVSLVTQKTQEPRAPAGERNVASGTEWVVDVDALDVAKHPRRRHL